MPNNIKLIYDLIQKDLKAQGWDDGAITEAITEAQRERQAIGADDKTICVKEMSYLSQESLIKIAVQMNNKENKSNVFIKIKNWIVNLAKNLWNLNKEAKIGLLFLVPSFIGIIQFLGYGDFDHYNEIPPITPVYYGLMAIAGAYLIKGNLNNKD